ncbi:MAG: bifunctional 3'-5' exonuclease/DNA polymerase [Rhodoglobus sp.]
MIVVLARAPGGATATTLEDDGTIVDTESVDEIAEYIEFREEDDHPRWVWDDTSRWYPELLAARVRVERCFDLRLCHVILRNSVLTASSALASTPPGPWDAAPGPVVTQEPDGALFDLDDARDDVAEGDTNPVAEFLLQRDAVAASAEPGRIGRLLAAESAGALIAAEMTFAGLPWNAGRHDEILAELLGPRPADSARPEKLQAVLETVRELLEVPELNPDSPADLLKALGRAGIMATSTRSWELKKLEHPVIAPLLEYKKLARLLSANGWHWLDTWVIEGRFRPTYVPGGVVTGRWASDGGGALQLPKQVRGAVIADDGWKLVVADASQLEPRVLAGMAADRAMAEAGAGDLYAGIVASGAVETRDQAKVAMLGAMYGATTGESGRLMPKLARQYPKAIGLVEEAARAGERGEIVTTTLGRSSPAPGASWREAQADAYGENATDATQSRARGAARSWGRFTRNFVVQGSAAEWALCWMASLRKRLTALSGDAWLTDSPHLVFFLHDEVVVHAPAEVADRVADEIRAAAVDAGRLLFGQLPITFPLTVAIVDDYGQAK